MRYLDRPLKEFLNDLSARLPAPGGGSAASFTGCLAAALNCMAANFTAGDRYKAVENDIRDIFAESQDQKNILLALIEQDMDAYGAVSTANKLPKETEEQKQIKAKAQEEASKKAGEVPLIMMNTAMKVFGTCNKLLRYGNKNLISDVAVAASLAHASVKSAYINVRINLAFIKDLDYKDRISKEIDVMLKESESLEKQVLEECFKYF
jgi:formiminotetrahydrofolate cyclodeaminase